jgi:NADH-quinone oxidoreductase subunit J
VATFLFYFFFVLAVGAAIGVVISKSPVGSLLFMVTTLFSISAEFVLLEAHFLAAVQVIVYAGAIMVLFLFVIMLLNLGHDYRQDLRIGLLNVAWVLVVAAMAGVAGWRLPGTEGLSLDPVGAREIQASIEQYGAVGAIAQPLYTDYVVPFEITGILLLVAIVGALVLAKRNPAP